MAFRKYQHIERYGTDGTKGIDVGKAYVFPKIDGSNASVWLDRFVRVAKHHDEAAIDNDHGGMWAELSKCPNIAGYLAAHPHHRLYGEWLVRNVLRTYEDDAWRKFYVFDVVDETPDQPRHYLSYDEYKPLLEEFNLHYIPVLGIVENGVYEDFLRLLEMNTFLIKLNEGVGEGIVIKNYEYRNRHGEVIWAKIISDEFHAKGKSKKPKITPDNTLEEVIVAEFCTAAFVEKEFEKLVSDKGEWNFKYTPMLLGVIYHEFVVEEIWNILRKHKNATINFGMINFFITKKVKEVKSDLFPVRTVTVMEVKADGS